MDSFIAKFPALPDGDLALCEEHGVAYQRDMNADRVQYGAGYLSKIAAYDRDIAEAVNNGRCALLARHCAAGATVLDVGAGDGTFVRCARSWGFCAFGFEVIPEAALALLADDLFKDAPELFDAVTLWDCLEHLEEPGLRLRGIRDGAKVFVSMPIFEDLRKIRESKHYRPGEHLTYWTANGFINWMTAYGFRLLEQSDHEVQAGRDSIGAFAFCRERT